VATLVVYEPTRNGDSKTYVAGASGGDQVPNDGQTILHFKNTSGGPITATINSQRTCDQGFDHDEAVVVGASTGDEMAGPYSPTRFNDGSGFVQITYSANPPTGLTVVAVRTRPVS
jgi:hypothetical protein